MIIRGCVVTVLCACAAGCDRPSTPLVSSKSRPLDTQTVMAKIQELNDEGARRYEGEHSHAEVSDWYLAGLRTIELSGCPAAFVEKFRRYEQAWAALQQRSQAPPEDKRAIKGYQVLFMQLKDQIESPTRAHSRPEPLLDALLACARELARDPGGSR